MNNSDETLYQKRAALFQVFSHEERLRILDEIRCADACVCHLQHTLQRPQVYVSQQLHILREAGIVESYRAGQYIFHRLVDPFVRTILEQVLGPVNPRRDCTCPCPHCQPDEVPQSGTQLGDITSVYPEESYVTKL
jgi:DNA-binding transcriptional ArsR family regulator